MSGLRKAVNVKYKSVWAGGIPHSCEFSSETGFYAPAFSRQSLLPSVALAVSQPKCHSASTLNRTNSPPDKRDVGGINVVHRLVLDAVEDIRFGQQLALRVLTSRDDDLEARHQPAESAPGRR